MSKIIDNLIEIFLQSKLEKLCKFYLDNNLNKYISEGYFDERIKAINLHQHLIFGESQRLHISSTSIVNNALFNLVSGTIYVGDYTFFGHNVSVITGTHDYNKFGLDRMKGYPTEGNDIIIEEGVWIASNVTIVGPAKIGKHSVVAAGSVVRGDVPSYSIVAGVPAKVVKQINLNY